MPPTYLLHEGELAQHSICLALGINAFAAFFFPVDVLFPTTQ